MSDAVLIALLSLVGTVIGSFAGILVANKLSNYRIEQLEKKLDKYADNQDMMRLEIVELKMTTKSAHKRIDDIVDQLNIHERRD